MIEYVRGVPARMVNGGVGLGCIDLIGAQVCQWSRSTVPRCLTLHGMS